VGENCSGGFDCASGICMPGVMDFPVCADAKALPCGSITCGLGSYCRMVGSEYSVSDTRVASLLRDSLRFLLYSLLTSPLPFF
jgi:hypothetical protein